MPRHNARLASPISPSRTTSIRKLTNILRPSRSAPRPDHDSTSPPSSPSLYSLSSESESRSKLTDGLSEEEPLLSPSLSTSASGEHGDYLARKPPPLELDTAGLELNVDHDRLLNSPTRPAPRPQRTSADFSWAMNKRVRPQRIIIADKEDGYITSDASSLRAGGIWDAPPVVTPSEWLASTRKGMVFQEVSSPLSPDGTSSSGSSPATPRVRPTSEMHRNVKPGAQVDSAGHSPSITGAPSPQRARSSSEPQRLFLGKNSPTSSSPHASTVPTTPTGSRSGFITPDATELVASSPPPPPPPPPPPSSLSSPITPRPKARMPDDVYFTAAGRRESRMYISPDAAPNHGQVVPIRKHGHSNSEPTLLPPPPVAGAETDPSSTSVRYATWNSYRKRAVTTSSRGRPFEDSVRDDSDSSEGTHAEGDSTPVLRREEMWSGEWNRDDIQEVIAELRSLK